MANKIVVNIITGEIISGELTNHPFANKAELYKEVVRCRDGCLRLKTEVAESDRWDDKQKIELDLMAKEYANKEKIPSDEFPGFQIMAMELAYKDGYRARQLHEKQEFATSYSHGSEVQKIAAEYVKKRGTAENLAPYEENRFMDGYLFALKQLELKQS